MSDQKPNQTTAAHYLPKSRSPTLLGLQQAARTCEGCDLFRDATQTVFGEGPEDADIVLVGEQPGDAEDRLGHPFVGPAGALLERALAAANLDRQRCYVTNAVKHFRWEPRGKRRMHKKPGLQHIRACRPWLEAEFKATRPRLVICLGAVAAQGIFGRDFRVSRQRGQLVTDTDVAPLAMATVHPASVLRSPDEDSRHNAFEALVADFRVAARALHAAP